MAEVAWLRAEDVTKVYHDRPAVRNVRLCLEQGQVLCLLGPSGCGKTTLLRLIAGLERPDTGRIMVGDTDITDLPPHRRRFGMMFQEYALFPHKNVYENVAFGLEMQGLTATEIRFRVEEMLSLVNLREFGSRLVGDLSGGERQRVALARSLAPRPRLLMLDEPLGSLDRALREHLSREMHRILKEVGLTAIFVTHDQAEAFAVADRVAVMNEGRIQQSDRPEELYLKPVNETVARFLGFENLVPARVAAGGGVESVCGKWFPDGELPSPGREVTLLIRPEAVEKFLDPASSETGENSIEGTIVERFFQGRYYRIQLETEAGVRLVFDLPNHPPPPKTGVRLRLILNPAAIMVLAGWSSEKQVFRFGG